MNEKGIAAVIVIGWFVFAALVAAVNLVIGLLLMFAPFAVAFFVVGYAATGKLIDKK